MTCPHIKECRQKVSKTVIDVYCLGDWRTTQGKVAGEIGFNFEDCFSMRMQDEEKRLPKDWTRTRD